jgi:cytochrome b
MNEIPTGATGEGGRCWQIEGAAIMAAVKTAARFLVWDPIVRYGHWALVAAFAVAYLSAEEDAGDPDLLHVWGGYVVGMIVILRIVWGVVGSQHARFSDFVRGPAAAFRYLIALIRGHAPRYLGHSPAGGAMVVALLVACAATVATGLVAYGDRGHGPLAAAAPPAIAAARADQPRRGAAPAGEEAESLLGELHGTLANITLGLVVLHILGVGLASLVHRENLVAAMITGRKRADD